MPSRLVLQAHNELSRREAKRINSLNHSSAFVAAISQTKPGKEIKNDQWLPFRLGDQELAFIDRKFAAGLLSELDDLPVSMLADLENSGILPRCREVGQ